MKSLNNPAFSNSASIYTVLLFKLLTLTIFIFLPLIIGPAACCLGPLALQPRLTVPKTALAAQLLPGVVLCIGLVCIHALALIHPKIFDLLAILIAASMSGLGYLSMLLIMFAWQQDFIQAAKAVNSLKAITAAQADAVLARFEQLKTAVKDCLFFTLSLAQIVQIFSAYNTLAGQIGNLDYFLSL